MSEHGGSGDPGLHVAGDAGLAIRRMRDAEDEYRRIVTWRNRAHVREWWDPDDPPMTLEGAVEEYRPDTGPGSPTTAAIIEVGGEPVGFIQYYPWSAYPEDLEAIDLAVPDNAWGLDIFIGEPAALDRGIGSRTVRLLCEHLFAERGAGAVAFGVEVINHRARRAYEKAGLTPTVEFLDTDTRGGERVRSVLMVCFRPGA